MRYPKFLEKNGTIGLVAPSFGCTIEPYKSAFENALKKWKKMGYKTDLGPNCYESKGIGISNTPKLCAEELNEWYCSDKNDVLIACGGGELMCEIVPFLDFERMKHVKPKWYMGLSDNTNFTFLSNILMDTAAIYGPNAPAFGMEPWHESITDAFDLLCGKTKQAHGYDMWELEGLKDEEHPLLPYNLTEPVVLKKYPDKDVELEGRLLGGCLDILELYPGTRYDKVKEFSEKYKEDGIIWFLESCDLNIMGIRRALWRLKESGWFSHVKGFLIGRPLCFGTELFGCNQYDAVTDLLKEFDVPIIMDLDFGHLSPKMPLISGGTAKIKVMGNQIDILYTFK